MIDLTASTETVRPWKSRAYWEDFGERFVGTFIQALLGAIPVVYTQDIDWINAVYVALFAAAVFALKGLAAGLSDGSTGASFGTTVPREDARTRIDEDSPTGISAEEGSDLPTGTPVLPEEPLQ